MRKIEKGEIDVDDSGLAQAVMGSKPAVKLRNEVQGLTDDPIDGVRIRALKKPIKVRERARSEEFPKYDIDVQLSLVVVGTAL